MILGGVIPNATGYPVPVSIVQLYDIPSNTWRSAAPVPRPITHPNAAAIGGNVYLLGGLEFLSDGAWHATPDCWVYNQAANSWETLGAMPAADARGSAAVGVIGETIYLAGGLPLLGGGGAGGSDWDSVDTVTAYNTTTRSWITLPEPARHMPAKRDHDGKAVINGTLYVIGGVDHGQFAGRDTVFALNLDDLASGWVIKQGKMPTARGGLAAAAVDKKVYTFGGQGNPVNGSRGIWNQTEVYDTATDSWTTLAPMKVPRHATAAVAIGGKIYIPGGGVESGGSHPVDTFDVFTP